MSGARNTVEGNTSANSKKLSSDLDEALSIYKKTLDSAKHPQNPLPGVGAPKLGQIEENPRTATQILKLAENLETVWKRPSTSVAQSTNKLLKAVQDYGPVVDAVIKLAPVPIGPVVWGSIRLVLLVGTSWLDTVDEIVGAFDDLKRLLPEVYIYEPFAQTDLRVNEALMAFQVSVVQFCTLIVQKRPQNALIHSLAKSFHNDWSKVRKQLADDAQYLRNVATAVEQERAQKFRQDLQRQNFLKWLDPRLPDQSAFEPPENATKGEVLRSILQSAAFSDWCDLENTEPILTLDISGPEGCGRSTLATIIADQLRLLFPEGITGMPFSDSRGYMSSRDMICAFILQLLTLRKELLTSEVLQLYDPMSRTASIEICLKILRVLARSFGRAFIIIDEISDWTVRDFIEILKEDANNAPASNTATQIRILYLHKTFVPSTYRTTQFHSQYVTQSISLDLKAIYKDIEDYARSSAKAIAARHCDNEELQRFSDEILRGLLREHSNNFKLMKAKRGYLLLQPTLESIRQALPKLPPQLETIYLDVLQVLQGYQDGRTKLALEILKCVVGSFRPLELTELQALLQIDLETRSVIREKAPHPSQLKNTVLDLCTAFVSLEGDCIRLASTSTKYFLRELRIRMDGTEIHFRHGTGPVEPQEEDLSRLSRATMTMKCLIYLSLPELSGESETLPALGHETAWRTQFPLFDYASNSWLNHLLDLADRLKNPQKGWRKEYGFPADVLEVLSIFLTSRNCWTFLEGLILFTSVKETREAIHNLHYPIRETGEWMEQYDGRKGLETTHARALENWVRSVELILKKLDESSSGLEDGITRKNFVLHAIRQCRDIDPTRIMDVMEIIDRQRGTDEVTQPSGAMSEADLMTEIITRTTELLGRVSGNTQPATTGAVDPSI